MNEESAIRQIYARHRCYTLPANQKGIPVEQHFSPGTRIPDTLKGAQIYQTEDGPVMVLPTQEKP